jgi:hypothetical protein
MKPTKENDSEKKIKQYHVTLLKEREIKNQLINKLEKVKMLVDSVPKGRENRHMKRLGLPFLGKSVFFPSSKSTDVNKANEVIKKIRLLLS